MNTTLNRRLSAVTAVVLIAAGSAFFNTAMARGDEGSVSSPQPAASMKSRAEVREETRQALRSGETLSAFLATYDVRLDGRRQPVKPSVETTARLR